MNILDEIVKSKKEYLTSCMKKTPFLTLERTLQNGNYSKPYSLVDSLLNKNTNGIIAEFKRQSPSKGIINNTAVVSEVVSAYQHAGVSGISILTDTPFFGGNLSDMEVPQLSIPLLRKDFMIHPYQILEARIAGASAILLIASVLSSTEIKEFTSYAHELDLEVLFEVHSQEEINKGCDSIDIYGVNNRNLKTFEVSILQSMNLFPHLPSNKPCISESGLDNVNDVVKLKRKGFSGFLMGENFMKHNNPGIACLQFANELKYQLSEY